MTKFVELGRNRGVDSIAKLKNPVMMVPLHGSNLVGLTDSAGYSVVELKRSNLTIEPLSPSQAFGAVGKAFSLLMPNTRIFRIGGRVAGEANLQAKKGRLTPIPLDVTVHPRLSFKLAFFFLQDPDKGKNARNRTSFTPANTTAWIDGLNDVYGLQANMWFKKEKAEVLTLGSLNPVVGTADDLKVLEKYKASGETISVFLAGSEIRNLDGGYPLGFYHVPTKVIVLKDQVVSDPWNGDPSAPMIKTLAHEIAHFMNHRQHGEGHDYYQTCGYISDILNTMNPADIKIPHPRVVDWNPW